MRWVFEVIERLNAQDFGERIIFAGDTLGRCAQKPPVRQMSASGPGAPQHSIGDIDCDHARTHSRSASQQGDCPAVPATKLEDTVAGRQVHSLKGSLGHWRVSPLHTLTPPGFSPEIELMTTHYIGGSTRDFGK